MIVGLKRSSRALLRRARSGIRLAGLALDRRRELRAREIAVRIAARHRSRESSPSALPSERMPRPGAVFDVIYAIGYWPGEPKRYRVFNMAEALRAAGYTVHVMRFESLEDIPRQGWRASVLVLFRAEYDWLAGVDEVLAYARRVGMRLVYDIDDLVFDPELVDRIDGLALMGPHERRQFIAGLSRRRRLLCACDVATASTAPLARATSALGLPSAVVPNFLNERQWDFAAAIAAVPSGRRDQVWIGYFSGSRTHQRDFAVCESALLDIMERHPQTRLRIVGHLDLGPQWRRLGDRIERTGLVSPDELLCKLAETDINLAPLEIGNPFCEAKSELKFFEAAVVGVPTVASATEPFRAAIEDGVSGFLARDIGGWRDALERLLASSGRRREMGEAGKAQALSMFSPGAVTPRIESALGLAAPIAAAEFG